MVSDAEVEESFRLAKEAEIALARTEGRIEGHAQGMKQAVTLLKKRADALEETDDYWRKSGFNMRRLTHSREIKLVREYADWLETLL